MYNINQKQQVAFQQVFEFNITSYQLEGWKANTTNLSFEVKSDDEGFDHYLHCYLEAEDLVYDLYDNVGELDLNAGGDDQFFDYSPDQLEGIIQGITSLNNNGETIPKDLITTLKSKLQAYFNTDHDGNDENDHDYQVALDFINKLQ